MKRIVLTISALLFCGMLSSHPAEQQTPASTPAEVDLRPLFEKWNLSPRRQGGRGTCSVFAVVGALEFAAAQKQGRSERLSVEYLNWASNAVVGRPQDGGFFSDLWKGFAAHGICPEEQMPYAQGFDPAREPDATAKASGKSGLDLNLEMHWIKPWNVRTGLTDEQFAGIKAALRHGWPVCTGLRWPKKEAWKSGVLQMCPPEDVFDGHSVLVVGYLDKTSGGVFIIRNSNTGRDAFMPYEYACAYMNDALWIDFPTPNTAAPTPSAPN